MSDHKILDFIAQESYFNLSVIGPPRPRWCPLGGLRFYLDAYE